MAKIVSTNGLVVINAVDLSDHCKVFTINDGQESREVTAHGNTQRLYRAGLGTVSADVTFIADHASGSVNSTIRALISTTSTGFNAYFRQVNGARTTDNEEWNGEWIIDGDVPQLSESIGEVPEVTIRLLPFDTISTYTSAS